MHTWYNLDNVYTHKMRAKHSNRKGCPHYRITPQEEQEQKIGPIQWEKGWVKWVTGTVSTETPTQSDCDMLSHVLHLSWTVGIDGDPWFTLHNSQSQLDLGPHFPWWSDEWSPS